MFILLLIQAVCPIIFLHIPSAASLLFLFTGLQTSPAATYTIAVTNALYPFFNPLIVVVFVRDYRTFSLNKLRVLLNKLRAAPKQVNATIMYGKQ
ncbi:hypothetical protein ANCCAN_23355 [Ancylostoma caninum]|uniref:G-protein coupled receptors family 1 profile domain-containing protein n=1 Tax=Ancylostoma caninum TaxID=29170 RepID=A0A368FJ23_ANCCA|nr:hypothetical protein ANCCAN_23355 [Ancylostoma caninum]